MLYTVLQGDCLSSIAKKHGFADWRVIYDHPNNSEFKKKRPDPNLIYPGDVLFIPDKEPKELPASTGKSTAFKVKVSVTRLRLKVLDAEDDGRIGLAYKLRVGGAEFEGETGDGGLIEHDIPADAATGEIEIESLGVKKQLLIGHLDPIEYVSGYQARLKNLGYDCGPVDGVLGPRTKAAVRAFQRDNPPLVVDGDCGPKTRGMLADVYGC